MAQKKASKPAVKKIEKDSSVIVNQELIDAIEEVSQFKKNKLFKDAEDKLLEMINAHPEWTDARRELIKFYFEIQNNVAAEKFILEETKLRPNDRWLWLMLAESYSRLGNRNQEAAALKQAFLINKDELVARKLFELLRDANDLQGAYELVVYLRGVRDTRELQIAEAKLLSLLDKNDEAVILVEKLLGEHRNDPAIIDLFATLWISKKNDPSVVVEYLLPFIVNDENNAALYHAIGRAYHRMDMNREAEDFFQKAIGLNSSNAIWWYDLSLIQRQLGDIAASQKSLEESISIDRLNPVALRVHGVEHKYIYGDKAFSQLSYAHANEFMFTDERKVELYFALAKAYEDLGELDTAYKYYENAGILQTKLTPYNNVSTESTLAITRDRVGKASYEKFDLPRCQSQKPVFVLGMPRSGTSLVEQVLSSHPEVHGAGELKLLHRVLDGISINKKVIQTGSSDQRANLQTYIPGIEIGDCRQLGFDDRGELYVRAIEALANISGHKDAKRIVDKMPGNYFWTGVIPFILPNAKVIHTQRHPLDNCLSIYRIFFPDGMPWSYDLKNLAKVYRTYYEHMNYWEVNLPPGFMKTINYEMMVNDFEAQARGIVGHLNLTWDDKCLKFYENDRSVKTASLSQVRKNIYSTSVGRWKKYESFLKPLIQELQPIIKHYDDKIESMMQKVKA